MQFNKPWRQFDQLHLAAVPPSAPSVKKDLMPAHYLKPLKGVMGECTCSNVYLFIETCLRDRERQLQLQLVRADRAPHSQTP